MNLIADIRKKAAANKKAIVLPEGMEKRTILAAKDILAEDLAVPVLLGDTAVIASLAEESGLDMGVLQVVNPESADHLDEYAKIYFDMRAAKGKAISEDEALATLKDPLYYGAMMVRQGEAAGSLAGAVNATGKVISAAARVIGTKPGIKTASSFFVMIMDKPDFGHEGALIYADCALLPNPDAETLADIAITTAASAKNLIPGFDPKVAMLSFSTKGSADHELVDKVCDATKIAREKAPDLPLDGELQADAALVPSIGERKAPGSAVAGKANILIFPNLDVGNIAYKLTERLAGAAAIGPIMQGFAKPVNDLSRGCSAEDIVNMVAVTSLLAD
ncbi:phosphate acetyltransferase [candidate division KSB3 bacterium]|uniref:Phosphate acetyltransferase n=1 Tax=candidate division KSB3 bacterium TaxID=2044937 RepID=A0A2G6E3Y7_9BACT|nr:MAG: phosphate acetyltransferase [candidate division KSB3 bacterium]PIE29360.1 MAG: phosphate acetyltransferase [candidate division KSB3 bacterium]